MNPFKNMARRMRGAYSGFKNAYHGEISEEDAIRWFNDAVGHVTIPGISISPKSAMKFSAVYACVSLLAGVQASLSCEVFKRIGKDERELAYGHRAWKLLHDQPSTMLTAYIFWETVGLDQYLTGNGYALIGRNSLGAEQSLSWLPANTVEPVFNPDFTRIWYRVKMRDNQVKVFDQDDILHFPCIGWDGLKGMSPISAAAEAIALGLGGEEYNARFFVNGVTSKIAIEYPKKVTKDQAKILRDHYQEKYSGRANSHVPFIATEGANIKSLAMPLKDVQLIESRDYQVEDIARFYGVPLPLIASLKKSTSFGTGLTEQTLGFLKFTLRKPLKMREQEINRKLLGGKFFCKFNLQDLLRADDNARANLYKVLVGGNQIPGIAAVNELRRLENMKRLDDEAYDRPYQPVDPNQGSDNSQPDPPQRPQEPRK